MCIYSHYLFIFNFYNCNTNELFGCPKIIKKWNNKIPLYSYTS